MILIAELESILKSEEKLNQIIKEELTEIQENSQLIEKLKLKTLMMKLMLKI